MPETPTYFIDRCLGSRSVADPLGAAGMSVERHDAHFPQDTEDVVWIPQVSARGWVVLTKDKRIRRPGPEREAVLNANARVFTFSSGTFTGAEMAQAFLLARVEMDRIVAEQPAPFVAVVHPGGRVVLLAVRPAGPSPPPKPPPPEVRKGPNPAESGENQQPTPRPPRRRRPKGP